MSYNFWLKVAALAIIGVSAQIAIGGIVRRFRTESNNEAKLISRQSQREELRWVIATLIVVLLLALMGEAVWNKRPERQTKGSPARSVNQN